MLGEGFFNFEQGFVGKASFTRANFMIENLNFGISTGNCLNHFKTRMAREESLTLSKWGLVGWTKEEGVDLFSTEGFLDEHEVSVVEWVEGSTKEGESVRG